MPPLCLLWGLLFFFGGGGVVVCTISTSVEVHRGEKQCIRTGRNARKRVLFQNILFLIRMEFEDTNYFPLIFISFCSASSWVSCVGRQSQRSDDRPHEDSPISQCYCQQISKSETEGKFSKRNNASTAFVDILRQYICHKPSRR